MFLPKFCLKTRIPLPPTFRPYGYCTFAVYQYNYRMCWCYSRSSNSKNLSVSGNNYVKVRGKGSICKRSKGSGDGPQTSAIFVTFFKNNTFTAYFGLKFLLKVMFLNYCKVCCVGVSVVDPTSSRYAAVSLSLSYTILQ